MRSTFRFLSIIGAAAALLGCADGQRTAPPAPVLAFASADEAYLAGRSQHLAQHLDRAVEAYEAALALLPQHVNARNGLATLYAEQGEFAKAIALWEALTQSAAGDSGPANAFLFSNLGYAHFLNGDYHAALAALEKACVLDPLNHRAWKHLGSALEKLGQHERAALMYKQAAALQQHDFRADYALAPKAGVAAIDHAVAAAPEAEEGGIAATRIESAGSGLFVMKRVAARTVGRTSTVAPAASVPVQAGADAAGARTLLEIRNGNGVTGMARSLAGSVGGDTLQVVRLSNQKGFGVQHTRVEYQPEFRDAAERLAARFGAAKAVEVPGMARADVRLIIGRDLIPPKAGSAALAAALPPKRG
ncbi:MAG: tetratricopeptide repeat protein [Gammaproteobacteria bacterium]